MEKLFGISINQLMVSLLVIFGVGVAVAVLIALRNRVMLKMAVRNIPRRRSQTVLIVLGVMLATILFSASFTTGDTMTHSIRVEAVSQLGEVDVVVRVEALETSGRLAYFNQSYFNTIQEQLSDDPEVEGVAPIIRELAPVLALGTGLNEPRVDILGLVEDSMVGFDSLVDREGNTLSLGNLASNHMYISSETADELEVGTGDTLIVFLGSLPTSLEVAGVYEEGAYPAGELSLVMSLSQLQTLTDNNGKINSIIITNRGDAIEGVVHTDAVISSLEPLLEGTDLKTDPVKQDTLDEADEAGSMFTTLFLVFGNFSIAAGVLLIFLIFVMLAAERKRELGIARAVGTQRGHVVRMFAFEGATYALIASAVGSLLGVLVGWAMVRTIAVAFGQVGFDLAFNFNWRSLVIAYTLGMVLTFIVVLISSWRVSRLNVVRAIRDIPEPRLERRSIKGLIFAILLPLAGLFLAVLGIQGEQAAAWMLGTSLVIIGIPLLAQRFGLPDRITYTVAGLVLVVWWLLPERVLESILPEMQQGMEMFVLSGIMVVLGAVWAVMYNSDLLLAAIVRFFGRLKGLAPVLKTAVSYPMQNRFRTGVTLALFALVIFTLVVMAFINLFVSVIFEDTELLSGGFHIRANTSYVNPIKDIEKELEARDGVPPDDFQSIGSLTWVQIKAKQEGTDQEPSEFTIQGVDTGYTNSVNYEFAMMAKGYDSSVGVWQALQVEPGTAVVSVMLVPTKVGYTMGMPELPLKLEGFWLEDGTLPEVYVQIQDLRTGNVQSLRIIGVLDENASYFGGLMFTSQDTVNTLLAETVSPQAYVFQLREGVDAEATAKALEAQFMEHGMQTEVIAEEIREGSRAQQMIMNLFQGFMGLGLVVGIAALGVIAARSVVERRQQIGVLRALGFQKKMVQLSFLLESSFVALLGIAIGVVLGLSLSYNISASMSESYEGLTYQVPWLNILVIVVIAYIASLFTTYLPARQASRVYPAEALRYE